MATKENNNFIIESTKICKSFFWWLLWRLSKLKRNKKIFDKFELNPCPVEISDQRTGVRRVNVFIITT